MEEELEARHSGGEAVSEGRGGGGARAALAFSHAASLSSPVRSGPHQALAPTSCFGSSVGSPVEWNTKREAAIYKTATRAL